MRRVRETVQQIKVSESLTQPEVAIRLQVKERTLRDWIAGTHGPHPANVRRLSEVARVPIAWLNAADVADPAADE